MTDARLKSYVERIAKLVEERKAIGADIADVVTEAKSNGYIPKTLRKVVTRYMADPSTLAEEDALMQTYEAALGRVGKALADVRKGATWEEAGKAHNVPRATLARAASVSKQREVIPVTKAETACVDGSACLDVRCDLNGCRRVEPPHDPETGEVIEDVASQGPPSFPITPQPQSTPDGEVPGGTNSETAVLADPPGGGEARAVNEAASGQPAADLSCGEPAASLGAKDRAISCGLTTAPLRPHEPMNPPPMSDEAALEAMEASRLALNAALQARRAT